MNFDFSDDRKPRAAAGRLKRLQPRGPSAAIDYTRNALREITGWSWTNGAEAGSVALNRDAAGRPPIASASTMGLTFSQNLTHDHEGRVVVRSAGPFQIPPPRSRGSAGLLHRP